jgi:hypothetical protein
VLSSEAHGHGHVCVTATVQIRLAQFRGCVTVICVRVLARLHWQPGLRSDQIRGSGVTESHESGSEVCHAAATRRHGINGHSAANEFFSIEGYCL